MRDLAIRASRPFSVVSVVMTNLCFVNDSSFDSMVESLVGWVNLVPDWLTSHG